MKLVVVALVVVVMATGALLLRLEPAHAATDPGQTTASTSPGFDLGLPFTGTKKHYNNFADYFNDLVGLATDAAIGFATLIIIYAGYSYVSSQGEAGKVSQAKELVAGSLTGLAILFLIRLILPTLNIGV